MLHEFHVSHFKAIGSAQTVPLKPITLIFGGNSGGKSSLLHALLLAHHAAKKETWDVRRPMLAEDGVDLGGFHSYVHRRDSSQAMELGFSTDIPAFCSRNPILKDANRIRFAFEVEANGNEWRDDVERKTPVLSRCEVQLDSTMLLAYKAGAERGSLQGELHAAHPLMTKFIEMAAGKFAGSAKDTRLVDALKDSACKLVAGAYFDESAVVPGRVSFQHALWHGDREAGDGEDSAAESYLCTVLADLVACIRRCFDHHLGSLQYLGPLRSMPGRDDIGGGDLSPEGHSSGRSAWNRLRQDRVLLEQVNAWLERLHIPYSLKLLRLADTDSISLAVKEYLAHFALPRLLQNLADLEKESGTTLAARMQMGDDDYRACLRGNPALHARLAECWMENQTATGRKDITMEKAVSEVLTQRMDVQMREEWLELALEHPEGNPSAAEILREGDLGEVWASGIGMGITTRLPHRRAELRLVDGFNGTPVSCPDVGVGINQALPVIVQACAQRGRVILIEQPELHLHPARQAELGDLFIESALGGNSNQFILETHSEHLILRLMKRMRQTFEGELPEGKHPLRMDDVCILYVEPDEKGSIVREMPLNERGELIKGWPGGFFEEALNEMF